ncbi:MAG: hypothetical protein ABSE77_15945, partial [Acidimicrobiales bacterium]
SGVVIWVAKPPPAPEKLVTYCGPLPGKECCQNEVEAGFTVVCGCGFVAWVLGAGWAALVAKGSP